MYGCTQLGERRVAVLEAAYMSVTVLFRPLGPLALTETSSGPVVTWGTPPRSEGCRSASQGLSLTLMTVLGRS